MFRYLAGRHAVDDGSRIGSISSIYVSGLKKTMQKTEPDTVDDIDWSVTTFEGARREAMRRWAQLPLEEIVKALEEMQDIADRLSGPAVRDL